MIRPALCALLLLAACRFAPTVDGKRINECKTDADCPCGTCDGSVCLPLAPAAKSVDVEVADAVVNAGEPCRFEVTNPACGIVYQWRQVSGPDVDFERLGQTIEVVTIPHVAAYVFEAETETGEARVAGRATCTALIDRDAAWVVEGETGTCSRDDPCGSFTDVRANNGGNLPVRTYLGRSEAELTDTPADYPPFTPDLEDNVTLGGELDNREIHGGFVYPGWARNVEAARTSLTPGGQLRVWCSNCTLTGLYQLREAAVLTYQQNGILIDNAGDVTLRETIVDLTGTAGLGFRAIGIETLRGISHMRDVTVRTHDLVVEPSAHAIGVRLNGDGTDIERLDIDMRAAVANTQVALVVAETAILDRVVARVGGAERWNVPADLQCAEVQMWNSILQATAEGPGWGYGAIIGTTCGLPQILHSCLLLADSIDTSQGLLFRREASQTRVINTIIHAGETATHRYGVVRTYDAPPTTAPQFESMVLALDPTAATTAVPAGLEASADNPQPEPDSASVIGCTDCYTVVEDIPFLDASRGDFRIDENAACCAGTGAPLEDGDPTWDFDRVPRPPEQPSVGPFEPVD